MKTKHLLFLGIIPLCLWTGCKSKTFQAAWIDKAVEIDGYITDWQGDLTALEDPPVGIGVKQDSAYLYLCFVTQDESLKREIGGRGMVLWLQADGKDADKIGIKYPTGMMNGSFDNRGSIKMDRESFQQGMPERGNPPQMTFDEAGIKLPDREDFELYKPIELEGLGICATIKETDGLLVYELKIPLISKDTEMVALSKDRPGKVNLVFEEQEKEHKNSGENFGGSRGPVMGGGRPPGGGSGGPEELESFNLKCSILLKTQK